MKKKLFFLLSLSAMVMGGCSKSEIDVGSINSTNAITFSTSANKQTKAVVLDENNVTDNDFGLYAYYTGQSDLAEYTLAAPNFMNDQLVEYTDGAWIYTPLKYWPNATDDMISFFGYLPKSDNVVGQTDANGELPIISFSQKVANPLNMIDLTVAQVLDQKKITDAVSLPFKHILTRLNFAAKTDETLDAATTITVTALRILGTADNVGDTNVALDSSGANADSRFYSFANYQFTTDDDVSGWDYTTTAPTQVATAMDLDKILDTSNKITSTVNQTSLFTSGQYLFLIPPYGKDGVSSENDLRFQIEYKVTTKDSELTSNISTSKTAHFSMPNGSLVEGKAYNAIVTISLDAVKVTATPEDWDDEDDSYTVIAGEAQSAADIEAAITAAYSGTADALTIIYKQNPDEDLDITIPDPGSDSDLNIYLDLPNKEGNISITTDDNYKGELTINAPNATVTVNGGEYINLTVWTAENTLIIAADATVNNLTIEKGNVAVYGTLKGTIYEGDDLESYVIALYDGGVCNAKDANNEEVPSLSVGSSTPSEETLATPEFDNVGMDEATSETISYNVRSGWSISSYASGAITAMITEIIGTASGVLSEQMNLDVEIDADEKVTVTIKQSVTTTTYKLGDESATVTSYGEVTIEYVREYGELTPQENN